MGVCFETSVKSMHCFILLTSLNTTVHTQNLPFHLPDVFFFHLFPCNKHHTNQEKALIPRHWFVKTKTRLLTTHKQTTKSLSKSLKGGILVPSSLSGMFRLRVTPLPASPLRLGGRALVFLSAVGTGTHTLHLFATGLVLRFPFRSEHQGAVDHLLSGTRPHSRPQAQRVLKVVLGLHVAVEPHDLASRAMHRPSRLGEEGGVFWGMAFRVG